VNKFTINKHAARRGAPIITEISLTEAHAVWSAGLGFRVTGFDEDGRRWTVVLDHQLVSDLSNIHARRGGAEAIAPS
jgi:hypothetical protein